jgi:enoyl-CoA hydratase/carnithine racemase
VGEKRAFELAATGRLVDANEALALGLVSRVLPAVQYEAEVESTMAKLAATPPAAIRLTKRLFYALDSRGFEAGIALGAQTNVESRATPEFREGMRRFGKGAKGDA